MINIQYFLYSVMGKKLTYTQWMNKYCLEIDDQTYSEICEKCNMMPYQNLKKGWQRNGRWQFNQSYICGLHALNMAWCMLGYDKSNQWSLSTYPYKYFFWGKWGLCEAQFAKKLIEPYFKSYSWYTGPNYPHLIGQTDFKKNVVIILISTTTHKLGILHYILIVGQIDSDTYIVTDQTDRMYVLSWSTLYDLMKIHTISVNSFNAYRVG